MLLAVLLAPGPVSGQSSPANRAEAVEQALAQVKAKQYDSALAIFRRLAEENPQDIEARVWVARLESWKGDYALAEEHYREVLRDAPNNLEAELGLVDLLSWQQRYGEAMERLRGLQAQHPQNTEVLLRLGKISRWQRHRKEALAYYEEVLRVDPANAEARNRVDLIAAETNYRLEVGYYLEEFDFARNTNGFFTELLYTDNDRATLLGRFQYQNKFSENNTRFTLGGTYRFFARTWLHAEASLAPTGRVVANQDYTLEVTQGFHPRFSAGGAYRFLNFRGANVHVLTALVNWDPHPKLHLFLRYVPSRTSFDFPPRSVWNQNGWVRLVWDAHRTFSPYLGFAVGSENFSGVSVERLGRFSARTYATGTEVRITPRHGFRLGYYYQKRSLGHHEQGVGASYFVRF